MGEDVILLDTNILIDLDEYVFDPGEVYSASILSRSELEFGIRAAKDPHEAALRTRRLNQLDLGYEWLEFDIESSRSYGLVAACARTTGAKVRSKDALIAAQAHRHGAAVMTVNISDFKPFDHIVEIVGPTRRN